MADDYAAHHSGKPLLPDESKVVGSMQEFRLIAWPELDAAYQRIAYRRMLSDMSLRHVSLRQLVASSGLPRHDVGRFVRLLEARGQVERRDGRRVNAALAWLRRAVLPRSDPAR